MKVLFVFRCNYGKENILIERQIKSIEKESKSIKIHKLNLKGNTIIAYLTLFINLPLNIIKLKPKILHAHYGLTILFVLLIKKIFFLKIPLVASFMGADILGDKIAKNKISLVSKIIQKLCLKNLNQVDVIIVKSEEMKLIASKFTNKEIFVIPNGVDTNSFYPIDRIIAREKLNLNLEEDIILFVTNDPNRIDKNLGFAKNVLNSLENVKLEVKHNLSTEELNLWYNAANCFLLTSLSEGSPNVIKEAMATNTPIVSSNVGDVKFITGNTEGCYICECFDINEFREKIIKALIFSKNIGKTNGLARIKNLGITSESISRKILTIYSSLVKQV